jgi:hypothetical protein
MMAYKRNLTERLTTNMAFSAFLFSLCGWGLIEAQLLMARAGLRSHLVMTLVAFSVAAVAFRRYRGWWPSCVPCATADYLDKNKVPPPNFGGHYLGEGVDAASTGAVRTAGSAPPCFGTVPWTRGG